MKLDLEQLVLLGLLSAALHWLFARANVTRWLWSRARGRFAKLLECAACSGFWLGLVLARAGVAPVVVTAPPVFETAPAATWLSALAAGVLAMIVTPMFEALMLWGLQVSAIEPAAPGASATAGPVPAEPLREHTTPVRPNQVELPPDATPPPLPRP